MRTEFSQNMERLAVADERIILLTGDLGFMALENVRKAIGERFINVGVSEQNMVSMAASLAYEGLLPVCYSIAPFIAFRPAEQVRIDICLHNLNVKLVGNGGGYGYGIMGATHHAIEDIAVLSSFQNMRCFIPFCNEDVGGALDTMFAYQGPSYLRLGYGILPKDTSINTFSQIRQIKSGNKISILAMGPVALNALEAISSKNEMADVFIASEIPFTAVPVELKSSLSKTGKLLVIEEHVRRGGLGENIASCILEEGISCKFSHLYSKGYPNGLYGKQSYHQKVNWLDADSILIEINKMING